MKLSYTTADGRMTVELEGNSDKELFRKLARFQEVYEDTPSANIDGKNVKGEGVKYKVRKAKYTDEKGKEKEAEYFEKVVTVGPMLYYKKSFGVLDDGTDNLFPKKAPKELLQDITDGTKWILRKTLKKKCPSKCIIKSCWCNRSIAGIKQEGLGSTPRQFILLFIFFGTDYE